MMPQWKDVSNRMTNLALSATGKRAAVEARGEIFTIPAEKGDVRNLTNSSGSAEIAPAWSPDGRSISYFSDKSGEYKLYIASQDGLTPPREITHSGAEPLLRAGVVAERAQDRVPGYALSASGSSTSRAASAKVADADPFYNGDRSIVPVWSPDSRYIAYPKHLPSLFRAIFLYDVETGREAADHGRSRRRDVAGVGRERQVPVVLRRRRTTDSTRRCSTCRRTSARPRAACT